MWGIVVTLGIACVAVLFWVWQGLPLGIQSKVAMLAGFRIQRLEHMRYGFYSHTPGRRANNLIISFAGGAMQLMKVPRREFVDSLADLACDQIFLTDPSQSWYMKGTRQDWRGYEEVKAYIEKHAEGYERVMCIGNCLGASGALLFSSFAHMTVAFNPHVNFVVQDRAKLWLGSSLLPRRIRDSFHELVAEGVRHSKGVVELHVGASPLDIAQAELLRKYVPEDHLEIIRHPWRQRNLPGELKKRDELFPLVHAAYQRMLSLPL